MGMYFLSPNMHKAQAGFSLIEILISLAICVLLLTIGSVAFVNSRSAKQLDTITDSIASKLEEARAAAISGKNGTNFGVAFSSTTYTYWSGSSYSAGATGNIVYPLTSGFSISSTIPGSTFSIRFSRVSGTPSATGTITITKNGSSSTTDSITVGSLGDITVIK